MILIQGAWRMARPKYESGAPTAKDRIEDAFWALLERMPYDEITLAAITREAKVNHNTLYYHFSGIDDLAIRLAEDNLVAELPLRVMNGAFGAKEAELAMKDNSDLRMRFQRICLLVSPNSPSWLVRHVRESVMELWLRSAGISSMDDLAKDEQMRLSFVINGILGMIGEYGREGDLGAFVTFVKSAIGKAMMKEIQSLALRSATAGSSPVANEPSAKMKMKYQSAPRTFTTNIPSACPGITTHETLPSPNRS